MQVFRDLFRLSLPIPCVAFVLLCVSFPIQADTKDSAQPVIAADGTVHMPAFAVPLSSYMSDKAKERFIDQAEQAKKSLAGQARNPPGRDTSAPTISKTREWVDSWYRERVERAKRLWPVEIEEQKIGGVRTHIITPKGGVAASQRNRVLINLHGGGFQVGAVWGGLAESIPVAGVGKFKVVTVDYRMAPEHKFPAASEDVASVYRELLKQYEHENMGIYGCSAGGKLTGMAIAWFQKEKLPRPGAIGVFCAGLGDFSGDSRFISSSLDVSLGLPAAPPAPERNPPSSAYLDDADPQDPLVGQVNSPTVLEQFPPTLFISGTRDHALSAAVHAHVELVKAGAVTDLHVWDGMGHNFIVEMDLPESNEAYDVIAKFFDEHLGQK